MTSSQNATVYEVVMRTRVSDDGRLDILRRVFLNAGVSRKKIIECEEWPFVQLSVFYRSQDKAKGLKKKLATARLKDVSVGVKGLKKKDWQTKGAEEFKPFMLTKIFGVIPTAYKRKSRLRPKIPVFIDADLAFGTGLHPTTRFMARLVERCRGKFGNFLDIGTGTGILSIIAEKCGATAVKAVDISRDAVKVAQKNCLKNRCRAIDMKRADIRTYRSKGRFDFVAANIITQELVRRGDRIVRFVKPGKYLAVSGISLKNYEFFRQAYARYPLRCVKVERGEGWAAVLFKKQLIKVK